MPNTLSTDNTSTMAYNVLFLCQENSGRSLMAEAMLNKFGQGRFKTYSAGINPADKPNPIAIGLLEHEGFDTSSLKPKHYSAFLDDDAPHLDFVFTLCENSLEEARLNIWNETSRDTITAHWHFNDPVLEDGDVETEHDEYSRVQRQLSQRIRTFTMLPDEKLANIANAE